MMRCILLFFSFSITLKMAGGQVLLQSKYQKTSHEISHIEAAHRAAELIRLLELPAQSMAEVQVQLNRNPRDRSKRRWLVMSSLYGIYVDALSGKISSFANYKRQDDQLKNRNRTGALIFPYQADARRHLMEIASKLGIPADAQPRNFSYKISNTKDQNRAGYFSLTFIKGNKAIATISCDIQDGVPTSITLPIGE